MDQLRADVLMDLIEGHGQHTGKGVVNITTDLETLTQLANHPGDLNGYGPVIADIARRVAEDQRDTQWRWTLTDPDTAIPIDGGITRRRPTTAQGRKVTSINPVCIHPGCRMPALDCDIDHRVAWAEAHTTCTDDLAPLCHHHRIKHQAHWSYQPRANSDYVFTTPLEHRYATTGRDP